MALLSFIDAFKSALSVGRKTSLTQLLQSNKNDPIVSDQTLESLISDTPGPLTQLPEEIASIPGYNLSVTSIAGDLGSIYAESNNLWTVFNSIQTLGQQDIVKLRLAIDDLESRVRQAELTSTSSKITYTDTIIENFNQQTAIEGNPLFYQSGTTPQAYIDPKDGLLKLPVDGEFLNELSKPSVIPSNVYLDRIVGLPVSDSNPINNAFDGTITNFWNETIHSPSPIYCTSEQFPWIPTVDNDTPDNLKGYKGGAACRTKIEFEHTTQISEIDIRPYGQCPMNLIAVGWTNGNENKLTDPTFTYGISNVVNDYWYKEASTFNSEDTGDIVLYPTEGPEGTPAVKLFTYHATGSVFLAHGQFSISNIQGLELSTLIKTVGSTPVVVSLTFISSGGTTLENRLETITLDSLGWTNVVIAFDMVPGTTYVVFRIGIAPNFERKSEVWIAAPFIEVIKEFIMYEPIDGRTTVFLPYPINVNRLYLVMSQENYSFKHYSLQEPQKIYWERLSRRLNTDFKILDWDKQISRGDTLRLPPISSTKINSIDSARRIGGTTWELLQEIEKYAYTSPNEVSYPVYEYQMGAFEIYLRHREYAPTARYVSLPITPGGEIRELRLQSNDSTVKGITGPDSIVYRITLNENDIPENGRVILNSNTFTTDTSAYPKPPELIPYQDWTTWSYSNTAFQTIYWPYGTSPEFSDILVAALTKDAAPGMYIQKDLSSPLDLRGAGAIVGEFFLFTPRQQRLPVNFNFSIALSSDNSNWSVAGEFSGSFSDQYNVDTGTGTLILIPFVINLTSFEASLKQSVQHIRITALTPTYYDSTNWILIRRLKTEGWNSGGRTIRFFPADDIDNTYTPGTDYIVPVKHIIQQEDGSDRYGRVFLNDYPYLNRSKILNLIWAGSGTPSMSVNLNGRRVPFDPNILRPKYINNAGKFSTLEGYRPIVTSLYFPDTGVTANTDVLGIVRAGSILQSVDEVLTLATQYNSSQFTVVNSTIKDTQPMLQQAGSLLGSTTLNVTNIPQQSNQSQQLSQRSTKVWQTKYADILTGFRGISVTAKWSSGSASTEVVIDPTKIAINASLGLLEVLQDPPNSSYTTLKASYWYFAGENAPREVFYSYNTSGSVIDPLNTLSPQNYPITRNVTDYMSGEIPTLKPTVLDPLDPNYYPVYEYYVHPNGYLVFAESLHKYSDTPAVISIEYDTLDIKPRISVDLTRPQTTSQTPFVDSLKLLMNLRRN